MSCWTPEMPARRTSRAGIAILISAGVQAGAADGVLVAGGALGRAQAPAVKGLIICVPHPIDGAEAGAAAPELPYGELCVVRAIAGGSRLGGARPKASRE